jgi:hypothetical protein
MFVKRVKEKPRHDVTNMWTSVAQQPVMLAIFSVVVGHQCQQVSARRALLQTYATPISRASNRPKKPKV